MFTDLGIFCNHAPDVCEWRKVSNEFFNGFSGNLWLIAQAIQGFGVVGQVGDGIGEGIDEQEILEVFHHLFGMLSLPQVIVSVADLHRRLDQWVYKKEAHSEVIKPAATTLGEKLPQPEPDQEQKQTPESAMLALWRSFFGSEEIE